MQHLDDGTIHAWLDGALGTGEAAAVEAHAAACRDCADRVAEARGLIAASSRILTALDDVPEHVVPVERPAAVAAAWAASPALAAVPAPAAAAPPARWGHRYGRLAAAVAFVLAGTLVITREANRHDVASRREMPRAGNEQRLQRDSAPAPSNAPAAAPAVAPQAAPAPPAALGGAARGAEPAPAVKPHVKSFAQEARQQAAAAKKSVAGTNTRALGEAEKPADTSFRTAGVPASSTLAGRRAGEGKSLRLDAVVVTAQSTSATNPPSPPRLLSVDSVERGGVSVRRQTYVLQGGSRVVLEVMPAPAVPNDSVAPAAPAAARADSAAADSSSAAIHVIRWRGADGTRYTLSGPVSIDELQRVRAALGVK